MDLPDAENRLKILKIFLDKENLEPGFQLQNLANATEGYSGSDLKVIYSCFMAAGRKNYPIPYALIFCRIYV